MKRFLSVSLVAVLAVSPMVASADDPSYQGGSTTVYGSAAPYTLSADATNDGTNVVTASYVKGAYNDLTRKINKVAADATSGITTAAGDGLGVSNGVLSVNVTSAGGLAITSDALNVVTDNSTITKDETSGALQVGTIANANVAANAAIDQSKIANLTTDLGNKQAKLQNNEATPVDMNASVLTSVGATGDNTHLVTEKAVRDAITAVASDTMTLTNKTFDANGTGNSISNLEVGDFAQNVVVTTIGAAEGTGAATNTELPTALAVRNAIADATGTVTTGMVTLTGTQTLTGKTISASNNTINDLGTGNFASGTVQTSVRAAASISDDTTLVSEKAVRTALDNQRINILAEWGSNTVTQTTIAPTPTQQ